MRSEPFFSRSPFFSPAFLRRLQKMIDTPRGRPTEVELQIDRLVRQIDRQDVRAERGGSLTGF